MVTVVMRQEVGRTLDPLPPPSLPPSLPSFFTFAKRRPEAPVVVTVVMRQEVGRALGRGEPKTIDQERGALGGRGGREGGGGQTGMKQAHFAEV